MYAVYVIDIILNWLTHPKPFLRRVSFLLLLASVYLSLSTFLSLRHSLNLAPPLIPTKWDHQDALAAAYTPPPPTPQQLKNAHDLTELIDGLESGFGWRLFQAPGDEGEVEEGVRLVGGKDGGKGKGVTAVVLHWKRRKGLELVLRHLARYPFIREVIVWNNRPGVDLKPEVSVAECMHFGGRVTDARVTLIRGCHPIPGRGFRPPSARPVC